MDKDVGVVVVVVGMIGVFFIQKYLSDKKQAKKEAEQAAWWANDYHNPKSPNYDAAKVAAEVAAEEAEKQAWIDAAKTM